MGEAFKAETDHINEQWPHYWLELFAAREYVALDLNRTTSVWIDLGPAPVSSNPNGDRIEGIWFCRCGK